MPKWFLLYWKANRSAQKGVYGAEAWVRSSVGIIMALESVGTHFEIQNVDFYRNPIGPCVFVGNHHMSVLETFVLPSLIQPYRDVTFVVKQSLISYPLFGPILRSRNPIVVGRVNPREDLKIVLEEGQIRLKHNVSVVIFHKPRAVLYLMRINSTPWESSWPSARMYLLFRLL